MASVTIIRKSAIPSFPENVRKYVSRYFREKRVLGTECLVAARHIINPSRSWDNRWREGSAPMHSVDLMVFGKSPDGKNVNDVLREAMKERPEDVMEVDVEERQSECVVECD